MRKRDFKGARLNSITSLLKVAIVLGCFPVNAAIIPNTQLPTGSDSIQTTDGFRCSQGIAADAYVEMGAYTDSSENSYNDANGGFVKLVIPLFKDRQRINCNKLYEMELRTREEDRALDKLAESIFKGG